MTPDVNVVTSRAILRETPMKMVGIRVIIWMTVMPLDGFVTTTMREMMMVKTMMVMMMVMMMMVVMVKSQPIIMLLFRRSRSPSQTSYTKTSTRIESETEGAKD